MKLATALALVLLLAACTIQQPTQATGAIIVPTTSETPAEQAQARPIAEQNAEKAMQDEENNITPENASEEEKSRQIIITVPEPPQFVKELDELLKLSKDKLKSYQYLELIVPFKKQPDTILVKGNKIKIKLYEHDPFIPDTYFDTVYIDTSAKTIVGRCENKKRCIWPKGDNTKKEFKNLDYAAYLPKLPHEWIKEIPPTAQVIGPEVHEKRDTTRIEYDAGNAHFTVWLDNTYGVPLEVKVTQPTGDSVIYKYNDPHFNSVSESDVTPPAPN